MPARRINLILAMLLTLALARLWIIQLPVSFWTDEMVTVFVVRHGANHPSLAIAPQVAQSIYYFLARIANALAASTHSGAAEVIYRIPSILAMGLGLFFVAKLAVRLMHTDAAWFAVFACLGLKSLNTEATDARPYALGICVSAAALFFLVRWMDSNRWPDAVMFAVTAALLWRVHLTYWPFYLIFAIYTIFRIARDDTPVTWIRAAMIFTAIAFALAPVAYDASLILRQAQAHVIAPPPSSGELLDSLKWKLLLSTLSIAILFKLISQAALSGGSTSSAGANPASIEQPARRLKRASAAEPAAATSSMVLMLAWWLIYPLTLFAFSRITGDSLFIPRYLSLALPGAAVAGTFFASRLIPARFWKFAALILGAGVVLTVGNWRHPWTAHANSDWRAAARAVNTNSSPATPVICLSPFIEAKSPEWRPDYPLPGFLYSYLNVYPIQGEKDLFPFGESPQAEAIAQSMLQGTLVHTGRFLIYGRDRDTNMWTAWFTKQPELAGWSSRHLGKFGDVDAVLFESAR